MGKIIGIDVVLYEWESQGTNAFNEPIDRYKDGVVVNEEDPDEIIDNGYALLGGNDVIKEAEATEEGTVYIRNLNLDIDYEVIMADENYDGFSPDQGPEDE